MHVINQVRFNEVHLNDGGSELLISADLQLAAICKLKKKQLKSKMRR